MEDTAPAGATGFPEPTSSDAKGWAAAAHLLGLLFGFLAPLVIWLIKKEEDPYVEAHAREALNFQLTLLIAWVVSFILMIVLIGFLLIIIVWIASLVFAIMAGVKAANGEAYRYPISIRFIKG